MEALFISLAFIIGFLAGALVVWRLRVANEARQSEAEKKWEAMLGNLSREALSQNQKTFFEVAEDKFSGLIRQSQTGLEEKKKLIDSTLTEMKGRLEALDSKTKELSGHMRDNKEHVLRLNDTTSKLRQILSSSQHRGQWGERMVTDILNFIGLREGINYDKQVSGEGGRPDFTFHLPRERVINMDVKFPLAHYEQYLSTESPAEKEQEKQQFLRDVRNHIKAVEKRGYANPAEGTVDYALLFIPNESIYYFINQEDQEVIDFALSRKIILCSPVTLYAVLSLIHQAVTSFAMERRAGDIQKLVGEFHKQWDKYNEKVDALGKSLSTTNNHFEALAGVRTRQLEKPVEKILDIRLEGNDSDRIGGND